MGTLLPPFHSSISTSLPQSTTSPTFQNILNQPIASLFPSQSTEGPKSIPDTTTEDDDLSVDAGSRNNVTRIEVDVMLKAQELRLKAMMDQMNKSNELQAEVEEMILKPGIPPSLIVSQDSISQMISSSETCLKDVFDPLLNFINLMPTSALLVSTGVQGGEKGVGASKI
ncbi:unnamed protein product [Lactuca saligna]|uniref:Uncharacterized protein n=1 Tax=Lactuca saligna TaxID=75948 RepID=A0AA35YP71_LACSI|nr:unnamed protein product [Lactuca saligna]